MPCVPGHPSAAYGKQTAQRALGRGSGAGGGGWNSDSLTYQGWKISGPPWPSAWGVAGMGGGGPEKMNKPGEAVNSA